MDTLIGHVVVKEPTVATEHLLVAAWHRDHEIQPGRYPVYATWETVTTVLFCDRIHVTYETRVVANYTPALLVGNAIAGPHSDSGESDIGHSSTHRVSRYGYQCPPELADTGSNEVDWLLGSFQPEPGVRFVADWSSRQDAGHPYRFGTSPVPPEGFPKPR